MAAAISIRCMTFPPRMDPRGLASLGSTSSTISTRDSATGFASDSPVRPGLFIVCSSASSPPWPRLSPLHLPQLFGQDRQHLEQIADDSEVRGLEDRRIRVLVDGYDTARGAHP